MPRLHYNTTNENANTIPFFQSLGIDYMSGIFLGTEDGNIREETVSLLLRDISPSETDEI